MATLVATEELPRATGSRMWVDEEGRIVGSVTIGGCVDARVIEAATKALDEDTPALLSMALDEDAWRSDDVRGTIEVLVEPVESARADDAVSSALQAAALRDAGRWRSLPRWRHAAAIVVTERGVASGR
jgi:xanthine/CO dehydrogenase XdhC/CoxF family maturation factor